MKTTTLIQIGNTLHKVNRIWNYTFVKLLNKKGYYNIKPSFFSVLDPLFIENGLNATQITTKSALSKQTVSIYIADLQQKGYVKIMMDTNDKRVRRIYLTAKGAMLKNAYDDISHQITKQMSKNLLDTELLTLHNILEKCFKYNI